MITNIIVLIEITITITNIILQIAINYLIIINTHILITIISQINNNNKAKY